MFIVGIDVGGTFTDLTAVDEGTGRVVVTKVPSQRGSEAAAVLAGLDALGIRGPDIRRLVHGTTMLRDSPNPKHRAEEDPPHRDRTMAM